MIDHACPAQSNMDFSSSGKLAVHRWGNVGI